MTKPDPNLFDTRFRAHFLAIKYWPSWLAVGLLFILAFIPTRLRDTVAASIARVVFRHKLLNRRKDIALVNLRLCFPESSDAELEVLLQKNFEVFCQLLLGMGEILVRSRKRFLSRFEVQGYEHIEALLESNANLIFLHPHCYCTDLVGLYFSSHGFPVTIMVKRAKNEVFDWLMAKQRMRYGGAIYERSAGIKTLIRAVRRGYKFFYLPDEDHGRKKSEMCHFFATQKATLPSLGPLARASRAKIVPIYGAYRSTTGKLTIYIEPPLDDDYPTGEVQQDTEQMNREIERLIMLAPEQYMWTLMILKTRPIGEPRVYKRKSEY